MGIRANKFTPEVLLSAPRRSAATPNSDGSLALFSVSTYSFEKHSKTSEIRILDVATGTSGLLTDDANASEPVWIAEKEVLFLKGGEKGSVKLMLADVGGAEVSITELAAISGPIGNLKIAYLDDGQIAIALTGQADSSTGDLFNPELVEKPHSSGKVYNSLFVRHWDAYVPPNKTSIFCGLLKPDDKTKYSLVYLNNILKTKKDYNPLKLETPVPPFGGTDNFDICENGIVFISKDPKLNDANHTKTDLYYVSIRDLASGVSPVPEKIHTGNLRGYCGTPLFSPDAKSLVFTRQKQDGYESDKPRLLLVPDITDLSNVQEFFETENGEGGWDRSPSIAAWSQDGKYLYLTAEEYGRNKLWKVHATPEDVLEMPIAIIDQGAVSDVKTLSKDSSKLFITSTSLIDNSAYSILDPSAASLHTISSSSKNGKAFGLSQSQVDEFWFMGDGPYHAHALIMKPSNFDKTKKYPLAFLVHGGPQGAWLESWSTRWNPAVFAEAGYVVVTPNPTGSTGYGMDLQNGIQGEWGGRPYGDLVNCFKYIEDNLSYIDTSRAVALGASYGGYMMNWIQGQPLGRKFKALVTHDGIFSTMNIYGTEEVFFPHHDFAGTLWDARANYEKWDPARYIENWGTPHLVVHNELDYRLPIGEGLAMFNVLQVRGVESRFLTFEDENHWVLKPENSLVWHREVLGWINKYSGVAQADEEAELAASVGSLSH